MIKMEKRSACHWKISFACHPKSGIMMFERHFCQAERAMPEEDMAGGAALWSGSNARRIAGQGDRVSWTKSG